MSHPNPVHDQENELPEDEYTEDEYTGGMGAYYHLQKAKEIAEHIKLACDDLIDYRKQFRWIYTK